ncbi:phospholipase D/nuclease [Ceraceosorus guamensis]|uniref:Phospholipase n=1 Tax=Ceraceosorus guamensis TaxID=1522189 RepID=A0A316W9C2_9BASI|nr:phospholipase D/nuclease [Ceraceosorus guamensis]PWN46154.1 phospholipase D/nuclease [Ceraceosorus guamensis]
MGVRDTLKKNLDPETFVDSVSKLGSGFAAMMNPNHRHDEAHEKEKDKILQSIRDSHRFNSFAGVRSGNRAKWYSDGHDYFWALSELLDNAKETIFILDWWLTPELYLRRPPHLYEEWRLDRLLKRKAEQGVQVRIIVYKEVTETMTMSSAHTKHALEDLHPNIRVFRHPDHMPHGEITLFYSHHDKVVVVDAEYACVGGLDICFGRWDTQSHPLSDCHPFAMLERTLFVGQDFNNARVMDFAKVDDFMNNQQSSLSLGRMPWHDVHVTFTGPSVLDVAYNFIERWNFVKELKYGKGYSLIAFPHGAVPASDVLEEHQEIARHPHMERFHEYGERFMHPWHPERRKLQLSDGGSVGANATMDVQVVRSAADWSSGILTEHSIQNALIELIQTASHSIYIENQFFITATQPGQVVNCVGAAIANRIISAAKDGRRFKVVIVIPCIPCFAGELQEAAGNRTIMQKQYESINRGGKSIMEVIKAAGYDPHEYISFWNLRGIDRIPSGIVRETEQASGITYHQAQVALARVYIGDAAYQDGRKKIAIKVPSSEPDAPLDKDGKKKLSTVEEVEMPATSQEALEILRKFANGTPERARGLQDSIASAFLHGQPDITQSQWQGSEEEEVNAWVTEETYVHSKLAIFDDRTVLIGSANLNDRSQAGDRDSETAIVIEDHDMFESKMDGKKYMASRFAASFRRHLYRQHLGLVAPQECTPETAKDQPTPAQRPAPHPFPDPERKAQEEEWEQLVEDPLSPELEEIWRRQARTNTAIVDELFQVVPSNRVRNWKDYDSFFVARGARTGHIAEPGKRSAQEVRQRLAGYKGSLVEFAYDFMDGDNFEKTDITTSKALLDLYT